jgi:bifunctional non-homologous end joining protein LigD
MGLKTYRAKRKFGQTPEPRGRERQGRGPLRFVVQKHQASRLHYDFRLELEGVLKSWAVPKGPSLNTRDRRLAMMVEDHPVDYRTFEGVIPEGNYGAGAVMVWDEGTYHPVGVTGRKEAEATLREQLHKGRLRFALEGHKLRGEFALVKLKRGQENAWLLIKKGDAWASDADVTEENGSVTTGRSLEAVARDKTTRVKRGRTGTWQAVPRRPAKITARGAPKAPMPHQVRPMLATLVEEPFDRPGWLFELKWDGYRAIAEVGKRGVAFYSRNHNSFEHRFAPLAESLRHLGCEAVLDGEVVVVDAEGKSDFQLLQNYQRTGEGRLRYYVFDLLYLDGRDLRKLPLRRRKELLGKILGDLPDVLLSEHVEERGVAFFQAAAARGLEGIMAKDGVSPYREGVRGEEWLKVKTRRRQEAVIGGFTEPRRSRKGLGALVLGVYEGDELVYIGHTGGGFDAAGLADMRSRLLPLVQHSCSFRIKPKTNAPVHWVAPRLVCEVTFQEWTQDGRMRQPIFVGLREDKPARAVRREKPRPVEAVLPADGGDGPRPQHKAKPGARAPGKRSVSGPRAACQAQVSVTHPDKVYWPEEGYTKGDLLAYYREVAPVILPYLRDRPQSLHRHPNGIAGPGFFQKDVSRQPPPDWVRTALVTSESDKGAIRYLLCQDEPSLLYLANLGCIELNPWHSRVGTLDKPDYLVIDLDPEAVPFAQVIETAVAVRKLLDRAGAASLCKTSGKRGLHVFVPLGARYAYEQAKQFAEIVANVVHGRLPGVTSVVRSPAQRQGRVYLDFLQNRRGQTVVAPYSVRPVPGATVSTPLRWGEVRKGLDPTAFTLKTMPRRLDKVGDLWQPALGGGIDLSACLERIRR